MSPGIELGTSPKAAHQRTAFLLLPSVTSRSHASNNETVSSQNFRVGSIWKSMTSEGNSALLPANIDRRLPLRGGLRNFQLLNYQLYNKSLTGSTGNSWISLFSSAEYKLFPEGPFLNLFNHDTSHWRVGLSGRHVILFLWFSEFLHCTRPHKMQDLSSGDGWVAREVPGGNSLI